MNVSKAIAKLAFSGLAVIGAATQAAPVFQVNTGVIDPTSVTFAANQISATAASVLLHFDHATETVSGKGYIQYGGFALNNTTVLGTGNANDYLLWAEFSYTTKYRADLSGGAFGALGSQYEVTSLAFELLGESLVGPNSVFNLANVATNTDASVNRSSDTKVLAAGSLVASGPNGAAINDGFGTSFNATAGVALTVDGSSFFFDPNPFYNLAFNSVTNTTDGAAPGYDPISGNLIRLGLGSINGGLTFVGTPVPEPASLALVGLGLVGLSTMRRRRT